MALTLTENGAISLASSGDVAVDFYFGMIDGVSEERARLLTLALYRVNPTACLRLMFDLRNHNGSGKGRRQVFWNAVETLLQTEKGRADFFHNLKHLPRLGYYKDLMALTIRDENAALDFFVETLRQQCQIIFGVTPETYAAHASRGIRTPVLKHDEKDNQISLAFKYAPTLLGAWEKKHSLATQIRKKMNLSERAYRWMCCDARNLLNIVEKKMCARDWENINFSTVSSVAMSRYTKAFKKHCPGRWAEYMTAIKEGKGKVNTSKLYPYELVTKLAQENDESLDTLFREYASKHGVGMKNVLIVGDGSGSMESRVDGTPSSAMDIMISLVLITAQNNTGNLHNKFILFSEKSQLLTIPEASVHDQINFIRKSGVVENTNVQAAFDRALEMMQLGEVVETLIIVSDMQFDTCGGEKTNYEVIQEKFRRAEIPMPRLVFWNVIGSGKDVPVMSTTPNCVLLSGFTPALYKRVAEAPADLNPLKLVESIVNDPMYAEIVAAPDS